jgi:predicted nucleic acid-binding protein
MFDASEKGVSMLIDTDVLIWVFRGNAKAAKLVESFEKRHISVITYMELIQGVRNRTELRSIKSFISDYGFEVIPLSENIGHRATIYVEEYGLAMAMSMADALIAASAVECNLSLCTGNKKHYKLVKDLHLKVFRPQ